MKIIPSLALSALVLLGACDRGLVEPETPAAEPLTEATLDPLFQRAGDEFGVPAPILKAIGFTETRWQMVVGTEEFTGWAPAYGIMALRGERLTRGAQLAGVPEQEVRSRPLANLRAAAALLGSYADELGINRSDLAAWGPVVARYSGIESPEGQAEYVHGSVYAALNAGAVARTPDGRMRASLMPVAVKATFAEPARVAAMSYDYPGAVWRPSPNYNSRPTGSIGDIHMVIIHTCEGSYTSCWSWLTNSSAGASAHYVVNESGSEISQLVREYQRAWHIGAKYYCSNNGGHDCWRDGYSSNHFTVGIEHGGYASQSSFPSGQIDASAKLVCDISKAYNIPRDRYHIVAHGQLQPYNRTDPGPNWPWSTYLNKINAYCGSGSLIIDSNNNNNDTSRGYIKASSNWTGSNYTSGYYGTGYYWANTQAISDGAAFWFYLPSAATKTIDAWWTAGSNRAPSAPFVAFNASGTRLGTAYVNQQGNGGKWNAVGTWSFSAGWNRVELSRWTTGGYVVIADALRVR